MVNIVKWKLNWIVLMISACKEYAEYAEYAEFQIPLGGEKKEYGKL
jgi:hypothetical protein